MSAEHSTPTVPITPYQESSDVDLADPVEHSREPRHVPPINRAPVKKTVPITPKALAPKGMQHHVRKLRWPELFLGRYGCELIDSLHAAHPPPAEVQVWIDEILASGLPVDQRGKFRVCIHPGFNRWSLFELVQNPKHGPSYRCISIFQKQPREGYLPADLKTPDRRWGHQVGRVGDHRMPTREDFRIIREEADLALLGAKGVAKLAEAREAATYNEKNRQANDYVEDMLDYNFLAINAAANDGRKQYSVPTVKVQENEERHAFFQRNGYRVKVKDNTAMADRIRAEENEAAARELRKLETDFNRQGLFEQANALSREKERIAKLQRIDAAKQGVVLLEPHRKKRL